MDFSKAYNRADFVNYLRRDFLPDDFEQEEKNVPFWTQMNYASVATCLGKSKTLDLVVYEIKHHSPHDARVGLTVMLPVLILTLVAILTILARESLAIRPINT